MRVCVCVCVESWPAKRSVTHRPGSGGCPAPVCACRVSYVLCIVIVRFVEIRVPAFLLSNTSWPVCYTHAFPCIAMQHL